MPSEDPAVRKTISLANSLYREALERMKLKKISSFSDYIQQLVRNDALSETRVEELPNYSVQLIRKAPGKKKRNT